MSLTPKNLNTIAAYIKDARDDLLEEEPTNEEKNAFNDAVEAVMHSLKVINPNFDRDRFHEACGYTSEISWNFDIEAAKTKGRILCCVENDENWVGFTWWNQTEEHWVMLGTNQEPMCWIKPIHPYKEEEESE